MIRLAAALAVAAASATAAPDFSWVVDEDIPLYAAAAESEAVRLETLAAQRDAAKTEQLEKQRVALAEKALLEKDLAALRGSKKADAEKKIASLATAAEQAATRAGEREKEAAAFREQAKAQRARAQALGREGAARAADAKKHALAEDGDLGQLPDARLSEMIAWRNRRLARVPSQLAALDAELERQTDITSRASVVARKDAVREGAAIDKAEIQRIADELEFRKGKQADDELAAAALEAAAKAKALENATPSPVSSAHSEAVDAALDRILEKQDREAADAAASAKTTRTLVRFAVAVGGFGLLAAILVFVMKGRGGA